MTTTDLDEESHERLAALQEGLRATNLNVDRLAGTIQQIAENTREDIRQLGREFNASRRPDWMVMLSAAGLVVVLCTTLGAAALAPLYLGMSYHGQAIDAVERWQTDYMKGDIPSSADPKLAKLEEHQIGIETQFRERSDANRLSITGIGKVMTKLIDRLTRVEVRVQGRGK